jgi:hypothetical protein
MCLQHFRTQASIEKGELTLYEKKYGTAARKGRYTIIEPITDAPFCLPVYRRKGYAIPRGNAP